MNENGTDLVKVARVKGAFGVKGEVRVISFTETPEDALSFGPLLGEDGIVVLSPEKHRAVKDGFAVTCNEVSTPEQADALRGTELYTAAENLPEPDEDEFYYSDLIGMQVKTVDGKNAGKVIAVHDFGAGDLLEIKPKEGGSFYHPFTKEATPKVDMKARRVIVKIEEAVNGKDPNAGQGEE
jgi:16S rRNA processing protein RimM